MFVGRGAHLMDVRLLLGTSKDDFARDKNEEHDLGVDHAVD